MRSVVLLVAAFATSPAPASDLPRTIKPVLVWTGTESKQTKESFERCLSREEWEACWKKHQDEDDRRPRKRPCPEVDFSTHMVVVLFHGKNDQNTGIDIVHVREEKELVRISFYPRWYQVGYILGHGKFDWEQYQTQSYAFVVLPRSEKQLVFEEDVRGLITAPPKWEERARIAAVKK